MTFCGDIFNNFKHLDLESAKEKATELDCLVSSITRANYYRNYSQCLECLIEYQMNGHYDLEDCA